MIFKNSIWKAIHIYIYMYLWCKKAVKERKASVKFSRRHPESKISKKYFIYLFIWYFVFSTSCLRSLAQFSFWWNLDKTPWTYSRFDANRSISVAKYFTTTQQQHIEDVATNCMINLTNKIYCMIEILRITFYLLLSLFT